MIQIYRGDELLCRADVADSFFTRLQGLMFKKGLSPDTGLLIEYSKHLRSRSVHGFFMRFPLDLIFLDEEGRIVEIGGLDPWRVYNPVSKCSSVLEMNHGFADKKGLKVGDVLSLGKGLE